MKSTSLLLALVLTPPVHAASPWLLAPGSGEVAANYLYQETDELFVGQDEMSLPADLEQSSYILSLRYGLADSWAADFSAGYAESDFIMDPMLSPSAKENGIIDTRVGLTWRLVDEVEHAAAPSVAVRLGAILEGDYDVGRLNAIGDGASGVELSGVLGKRFGAAALSAELGYRERDQEVPSDAWLELAAHYSITHRVGVRAAYLNNDSDGDLDIGGPGFTPARFPEVEEDYELWQLGVDIGLGDRFGVALTGGRKIDGRNTAKSDVWGLSVGYGF